MPIITLHIIIPDDRKSERGQARYFAVDSDTFDSPIEIPGYTHEVREYDVAGPNRYDGKTGRQMFSKALRKARKNGWAFRSRLGRYDGIYDIVKGPVVRGDKQRCRSVY